MYVSYSFPCFRVIIYGQWCISGARLFYHNIYISAHKTDILKQQSLEARVFTFSFTCPILMIKRDTRVKQKLNIFVSLSRDPSTPLNFSTY